MTLDGFLTFFTIAVAVYAASPTSTRLRLRLRKVWLLTCSLVCFLFVLYLELAEQIPCPPQLDAWCGRLQVSDPAQARKAAFLVVVAWLLLASIALAKKKLRPGSLPTLSQLVSELAYQQRYADLVALLEPQLPLLVRAAKRQTAMARLHDFFEKIDPRNLISKPWLALDDGLEWIKNDSISTRIRLALRGSVAKIASIIPAERRKEQAAQEIFRILFNDPSLISFVAKFRPEFGTRLLGCDVWGVQDFCYSFLTELIKSPESLLYKEINQNQNLAKCGYAFPPHNLILHYLFSDANQAKRLAVWKPIGDYLISLLSPGHSKTYASELNRNADGFYENDRWHDPVFIGLSFFDLMVRAAACQNIPWHMWLYYYPPILEQLTKLYDISGSNVDLHQEWPTRASYLIYVQFDHLLKWIKIIGELPEDSLHRLIEGEEPTHQNDNIPKSAALALGSCLWHLISEPKIPESFQKYIHDMVLGRIKNLLTEGDEGALRRVVIRSIIRGGQLRPDLNYGKKLKRLWARSDFILRDGLEDYKDALETAYGEL